MGFGRVKFKPAFYPYTEPSVDVVVYMESRAMDRDGRAASSGRR